MCVCVFVRFRLTSLLYEPWFIRARRKFAEKDFRSCEKLETCSKRGEDLGGGERKRFPNEYKYPLYNVVNVINSLAEASE